MSRRSRAGTAEKPPSVEETLGRLEVKLKELELKYELREKEEAAYRAGLQDTVDTLRIAVQRVQPFVTLQREIQTFPRPQLAQDRGE